MSNQETRASSAAIPCLRYRDAPAAIDWLCSVFGFQRHMVVPGDERQIVHAQLQLGGGMIMLGSLGDSEYGRLIKQPDEIGGTETQSAYLIVTDADAVHARAKKAGGTILIDIKDEGYGRGFTCSDPQGHIWTVGTYDPWTQPSSEQ